MGNITNTVYDIATWLVPLAIAIVFHEVAHGRVAQFFGDNTARDAGRLSLNPLRHIDPIGTIILPMFLAITHLPIFGWAKPVPVVSARLRNPRWHMVLVAAAGPASNIILALMAAVSIGLFFRMFGESSGPALGFVTTNLSNFIGINLFLALFNMIPLPPFDGSKVFAGFLPDGLRQQFQRLDRYALLFIMGLLFIVPQFFPNANILGRLIGPPYEFMSGMVNAIILTVAT
jgi:Zn-dependent protease